MGGCCRAQHDSCHILVTNFTSRNNMRSYLAKGLICCPRVGLCQSLLQQYLQFRTTLWHMAESVRNPGSNCYFLLIDPGFIPISSKRSLLFLLLNSDENLFEIKT
jgi:hypothetical protein